MSYIKTNSLGKKEHIMMNRSGKGVYKNTKFSSLAEIFDSPYIVNSFIYGGQIFDSPVINNSSISGYSRISGYPQIINSHISGTAQISGTSNIKYSVIAGNSVVSRNARVFDSELYGNTRVLDKATIQNVLMDEQAIVCGNAVVEGKDNPVILSGWDFISEGVWHRSPVSYVASSGFVVTESIDRNITINCITATVESWLKNNARAGRRYGGILGLDKLQIDELESYIVKLRDFKNSKFYQSGWYK